MTGAGLLLSVINKDLRSVVIISLILIINLSFIYELFRQRKNVSSLALKEVSDVYSMMFQISILLCAIVAIMSFINGIGKGVSLIFITAVIIASLPISIFTILYLIFKKPSQKLNIKNSLNNVDIGSVEYIVGEFNNNFIKKILKINEIYIGKDKYTAKYSENNIDLINSKTGKANSKQLESLQLFFRACSTNKDLIPLSIKHLSQSEKTNDMDYKVDDAEKILITCKEIWDHGHIRKLTSKDRLFLHQFINSANIAGNETLGLCYREKTSKDLVLLGVVSLRLSLDKKEADAIYKADKGHIKLILFTDVVQNKAETLAKLLGLNKLISQNDVAKLTDAKLYAEVSKGVVGFRLNDNTKNRIVNVLNDRKKFVLTTTYSKSSVQNNADINLRRPDFTALIDILMQGRTNQNNINIILRSVIATCFACLSTVVLGVITISVYKIAPVVTTPFIVLIALLLILPLAAIIKDRPIDDFYRQRPKDPEKQIFNFSSFVGLAGFGLITAFLSYASYLLYFQRIAISPVNLTDFSVPLYHQATTQAFLVLYICSILYIFFERADSHKSVYSQFIWSNGKFLAASIMSTIILIVLAYTRIGHTAFQLTTPNLADWFVALGCGVVYIVVRQIQRYTRKHTRKAIIELQNELTKQRKLI